VVCPPCVHVVYLLVGLVGSYCFKHRRICFADNLPGELVDNAGFRVVNDKPVCFGDVVVDAVRLIGFIQFDAIGFQFLFCGFAKFFVIPCRERNP
jgi:hypothetical protein